jgi:selenoprotein W-related protein
LEDFEDRVESIALVPSDGGKFEVTVNGRLIYSKVQTRRHVEPGEVRGKIQLILTEAS